MRTLVFLLILLAGCSSLIPDDIGVSVEDLPGAGNPDIEECQIVFNGEVPLVPCVIQLEVSWDI